MTDSICARLSRDARYACTLPAGHADRRHVAHGPHGETVSTWVGDYVACPAPGVYYAGTHLERMPRSATAPVLYCATCLGFGTVDAPPAARCEAEWVAGSGGHEAPRCTADAMPGRMFCAAHESDYAAEFGHASGRA